jgi:hypothetical protein
MASVSEQRACHGADVGNDATGAAKENAARTSSLYADSIGGITLVET